MTDLKILAYIVLVAIIVYVVSRYIHRWQFIRGRRELAIAELLNPPPSYIDRDKASALLHEVAKCFRLKSEILRLEDKLSSLAAIDSWDLGGGQEDLELWLSGFGISELNETPSTLGELISAIVPRMTKP